MVLNVSLYVDKTFTRAYLAACSKAAIAALQYKPTIRFFIVK